MDMDQEELYQSYQSKLGRLEEQREDYERSRRRWEQVCEGRRGKEQEIRQRLERSLHTYHGGAEVGVLAGEFEELMTDCEKRQHHEEEALVGEYRQIKTEMARCEEWYEAEMQTRKEETLWPE